MSIYSFGSSDTYGLFTWAQIMRQKCMEAGRKLPMNNKDKGGLDTTETDRTAPKSVVQDSNQASPDNTQINTEGGM